MPPPVADDDHKRRARRRLIGAVALTIIAVIILPLVLEDEPPPAGPLEVRLPPAATAPLISQNAIEFAPPQANTVMEPAQPEPEVPVRSEADKPAPAPAKPVAHPPKEAPKSAQTSVIYTVQVGVFVDKANVERLQSRISALGHKPYTDVVGDSTRVRVGSFPNKADADALSAKLAVAGITAKVVEK